MSETMREALPIIFMYGCVLLLGPFIAVAMWMAFDGDRLREDEVVEEIQTETEAPLVDPSGARAWRGHSAARTVVPS